MICCSFASTSSSVHDNLIEFCDISRAEVATPPALAAFAGPTRTPLSINNARASLVVGMFDPSITYLTSLAIIFSAS